MSKHHHTIPIISRRELGAVAVDLFPGKWTEGLAEALDWNPRTVQRLGTDKMPIDRRRALLMADLLGEVDTLAAKSMVEWLRARLLMADNQEA